MNETETTSVVLVDDHDIVRRGIRNLLDRAPDIVVVGEARDGFGALRSVTELAPDVLLLDIEMPGLNGIEVTRRLYSGSDTVKILILSAYDDQEYITEVLDNGASGYIIKGEAPEWVVEAIRGVARGEKGWVSPRVAERLLSTRRISRKELTLTFREIEILRLLSKNEDIASIASEINLPVGIIHQYLRALLIKLNAESKDQAITIARKEGWL
jgi:DNA-binding NarL/FixJ family response regulator